VLIQGDTGTGKGVLAAWLHHHGPRAEEAFVDINCAGLSRELMESELFGHERGSFTGADRRHKGYFERASRGTLFLDEITEMPIELQVKLLRVLETGTFARVGGEEPISVDVRILAATNRNVQDAITQGKLREDLYYRLKVFQLSLPPLRERPHDVPLLAQAFLEELGAIEGQRKRFTDAALERLSSFPWPGNVRELRNVVHSAYILAGSVIDVNSLPRELGAASDAPAMSSTTPVDEGDVLTVKLGTPIADVERRLIIATLKQHNGSKTKAAEALGISLKTLYNRLAEYQDDEETRVSVEAQES